MSQKPGAVIAILTWRGETTTRACLASLRRPGGWTGRTLVIDNGSQTGEGERLAAEFGVASVTLPENGGVAVGYNAAISWAQEQGASHVLLSNNDLTFTDPDLATQLLAHAAPDIAAIGPVVRSGDGTIVSAGGRMHRWTGHAERTRVVWASRPYEVDTLDGSCMLVSIEAVCTIGGLAPEFFLYWEETDWCTRAREAGFRLVVDPSASVIHAGTQSGDLRQTRRYALRNSLLYLRRNVRGTPALTTALAWWLGRVPVFLVRRVLERAGPRSAIGDASWAISWHWRDIRARGWRRAADGPDLCAVGGP